MTILLIILASILSITLGGLFAIKFKDKLHLILGFGAGTILGVALFDLLPESIQLTRGTYDIQTITLLIALGFAVFMLIDRFFLLHGHNDGECENPAHSGEFKASTIILHSALDGFSIGMAFKISPAVGLVVAFAVLIHGFSDGINTVNMIIKNESGRKTAIKWLAINAFAPTIGIIAAYFIKVSNSTLGLILAVFIGSFLYISASDLIPESHHHHPVIWTTISTILGMSVIYVAIALAG